MFLRLEILRERERERPIPKKEMGLEDDGPNVKKEERIVVYQHINAPADILPTRKKASTLRRLHKNSVRGFRSNNKKERKKKREKETSE